MAVDAYIPLVKEIYYEMWEDGGDLLLRLPSIADQFVVGEDIYINETGYKIERLEYHMTTLEDWPGPEPPAYDRGFDVVYVKVIVSGV